MAARSAVSRVARRARARPSGATDRAAVDAVKVAVAAVLAGVRGRDARHRHLASRASVPIRAGQRKHVCGPAAGLQLDCPDHHRVAVDRDAGAEVVIRRAVARRQLCNLRPAGGEVAGRGSHEHVRGSAFVSLVVVQVRPDRHRVAVDRHAPAEPVIRSAVVRGQLGNLRPAGGKVAGCVARVHVH